MCLKISSKTAATAADGGQLRLKWNIRMVFNHQSCTCGITRKWVGVGRNCSGTVQCTILQRNEMRNIWKKTSTKSNKMVHSWSACHRQHCNCKLSLQIWLCVISFYHTFKQHRFRNEKKIGSVGRTWRRINKANSNAISGVVSLCHNCIAFMHIFDVDDECLVA